MPPATRRSPAPCRSPSKTPLRSPPPVPPTTPSPPASITPSKPGKASPRLQILGVARTEHALHVRGATAKTLVGHVTIVVHYTLGGRSHSVQKTVRLVHGKWAVAIGLPGGAWTSRVNVLYRGAADWLAQAVTRYVHHRAGTSAKNRRGPGPRLEATGPVIRTSITRTSIEQRREETDGSQGIQMAVARFSALSLLTAPSPATANSYHDFLCRIPYGASAGRAAPADGVTYAINNDFVYAEDTCSANGSLYAQMVGETTHGFGTEAADTFNAPAGLTISRFVLWRYEADRPGQPYGTPASNLTYGPGGPISVQGLCTEGCSRGTPSRSA